MRAGGAGVGQAGYAVATGGFIPMVGTEDELGSEHKFAEPMARPSGAAQQYCNLTPIRPLCPAAFTRRNGAGVPRDRNTSPTHQFFTAAQAFA